MRNSKIKSSRAISLAIALAISGALYFKSTSAESSMPNAPYQNVPVGSMWISVEAAAKKAFLNQLEQFAARRHFKMRTAVVSRDGGDMSIDLQGEDFRIVAVNDAGMYEVAFYASTVKPATQPKVDELIRDVKDDLGRVPGVSFPTPAKRPFPANSR